LKLILPTSGLLRRVGLFGIAVSGLLIGSTFKGQAAQEGNTTSLIRATILKTETAISTEAWMHVHETKHGHNTNGDHNQFPGHNTSLRSGTIPT
jgi:hypothetical protein